MKISVSIIGTGNIGTHLARAFHKKKIPVDFLYNRESENNIFAQKLADEIGAIFSTNIKAITNKSKVLIIATNDNSISKVIQRISKQKSLIVHTAGSVDMDIFKNIATNYGVFYPFQTFSKAKELNFTEIPICIEANTPENELILENLARKISTNIYFLNSEQRRHLHLSGVFINNFTNHMIHIAENLLAENNIDFKLIEPLIAETFKKLEKMSPAEAQTGPALRNENKVQTKHKAMLRKHPNFEKIYSFVSQSIFELNKKQLKKQNMPGFFKDELTKIKAFVFDVDGVLSAQILLHPNGDLLRHMNAKDGFAMNHAVKQGFQLGIITGGKSELVKQRFNNINVTDVYLGSHDKLDDLTDFVYKYDLTFENILYMGDDIPDYEVMTKVGLACAPADAAEEIKNISHYVSDKNGGEGCVRDIIEQVLKAQDKWFKL